MNPVSIGRVVWPGPVGIGAGLVKNGLMLLDYGTLAGAVEIGSITRHLSEGNSGRTVWKYPRELSIRHNAGMPNYGVEHLAEDLVKVQEQMKVPWGINVAVSPGITGSQEAAIDIRGSVGILLASGLEPDWITLNVASPDTQDSVEMLSEPERVKGLITAIQAEFSRYDKAPLWLKIGPALTNERLTFLATLCMSMGVEAIVCGNALPDKLGGGWCGAVIKPQADAILWQLKQIVGDKIPLVGLGGVMGGKDALHKLDLGARVVQVVSALLTRGREAVKIIESEMEGKNVK